MDVLGLQLNLIWAILAILSIIMIILGGIVNYLETFLPQVLNDAFRYGKASRSYPSSREMSSIVLALEVPKYYFQHFYIFACLFIPVLWTLCLCVYFFEVEAPPQVLHILDFVATTDRKSNTSAEAVAIAMTLLLLQVIRRLYETTFVNVKSSAKMNILHYFVGFIHYFCAGTGILVEAPGFVPPVDVHRDLRGVHFVHVSLDRRNLSLLHAIFVTIFFYSWWQQYNCAKILAALRQTGKAHRQYSIPNGGWFEYVSCPHYLFEVLIYGSLSGILGWKHQTFAIVFIWVVINQTVAALMSHFWYQEKFETYPRQRRAIFPFLL